MIVKCFIFSYNREQMLNEMVVLLNSYGISPIILDDGSDYETNLPRYFRHEHRGKNGFYKTWHEALKMCENSSAELYMFLPDDFLDLDVQKVLDLHESHKSNPYAYNFVNVGLDQVWTNVKALDLGEELRVGFVDCGFFCNREALERIGFFMDEPHHFFKEKESSSGVGCMLSNRLLNKAVLCYLPKTSLAYHGEHESVMHPELRKKNPLISK